MIQTGLQIDPRDWLPDHGDVLYRHALRSLNCPEMAADFVQDTLLQGIRSLSGFQGRCSMRTWLLAILKNRIIDHFRKQSRQPARVGEEECEVAVDEERPDLIMEEKQLQSQLQQCIDQLPVPVRRMFVLSEVDGYQHSELADRFELTPGNVRVRLHRARLKVRDCLVGKGVAL